MTYCENPCPCGYFGDTAKPCGCCMEDRIVTISRAAGTLMSPASFVLLEIG